MTEKIKPCPVCGKPPQVRKGKDGKPQLECINPQCFVHTSYTVRLEIWNNTRPIENRLRAQRDRLAWTLIKAVRKIVHQAMDCPVKACDEKALPEVCPAFIHNDKKKCRPCLLKYFLQLGR